MKKKRICILSLIICVSVCLILLFKVNKQRIYEVFVRGERVIPCEELQNGIGLCDVSLLLQKCQPISMQKNEINLIVNNTSIPYISKYNQYLLCQNMSLDEWDTIINISYNDSSRGWQLYGDISDVFWKDKKKAIETGHVFDLWLVNGDVYFHTSLVISGIPVIEIVTYETIIPEPVQYEVDPDKYVFGSEIKYKGEIKIWDIISEDRGYVITEAGVIYHEKGIAASYFPKKSYSLSLLDYKGSDVSESLLGMSSSNVWKLNASYGDITKIREKAASTIWNQMVEDKEGCEYSICMEYVEVIIDGEYLGIYNLVEPVNEEQLCLKSGDYLYKGIADSVPTNEDIQYAIDNKWKVQTSIRIRYPKEISNYEEAWKPIREYFDKVYANGALDVLSIKNMMKIENLSKLYIFMMATSASDNSLRNIYYVADKQEDGTYKLWLVPWDFDLTFGSIPMEGYTGNTEAIYGEMAMLRLYSESEDDRKYIKELWQMYRKSVLSTDNICSIFKSNLEYLTKSGAYQRECNRWPEAGNSDNIDYLIQFQEQRMEWLDSYFDN